MAEATEPDPQGPPSQTLPPLTAPPARAEGLDQRRVFRWFFFGVFALLIYQLLLVLSLFSDIIIWAASLALVCFPIHAFLQRRLPGRPGTAAALSTLVVLLLVLVPLLVVASIVVQQSAQLYPTVRGWVAMMQAADGTLVPNALPEFAREFWERLSRFAAGNVLLAQFDLEQFTLSRINAASAQIANFGARVARNIVLGLVNLLAILVLMFFCFRDGERFMRWVFETVPMPVVHAQTIALRIYTTVTAVVRGALATAMVQGVVAMIGYLIAGVPLALFFGVVTGVAAMIPVVGAALVWAPIGIFVFLKEPGWGVFVLAWGFFLVSLVDNFLKPVLIGTQARMPILLIFCGIIGGVNVYGVTGVMIGPILMATVLAFARIYREHYSPAPVTRVPTGEGG